MDAVVNITASMAALRTIGEVIGALAIVYGFGKTYFKYFRNRQRFEDRLFGTPGDPLRGIKASPGIFEILDGLKDDIGQLKLDTTDLKEDNKELKDDTKHLQIASEYMKNQIGDMTSLTRQLRPNGGSSLADKINSIDSSLKSHLEHSLKVEKDLKERIKNHSNDIG